MLELHAECQGVIIALSFAFHRILVVAHIFPVAIPTFSELFGFYVRVHEWLHPVIVQTVRLKQVDDVESVEPARPSVLHTEIVPLGVASGAVIRL